ncbi:outer membrane protein [Candidatus Magnetaquicoccus inordinatus]|uniref:outer membrane protein n=1 Tax=Candidatus Magnetaquicoccus inordinatus TaxID=2496818 RepID=UPI00102CD21C|nr:hypothetical protein [Candidatus Magnetaquicoccus inordinatus]
MKRTVRQWLNVWWIGGVVLLGSSTGHGASLFCLSERLQERSIVHSSIAPSEENQHSAQSTQQQLPFTLSTDGVRLQSAQRLSSIPASQELVSAREWVYQSQPSAAELSLFSSFSFSMLHAFYQDIVSAGSLLKTSFDSAVQENAVHIHTAIIPLAHPELVDNTSLPSTEQLGLAVSYKLTDALSADLNYRLLSGSDLKFTASELLNPGINLTAHEFSAGMRIDF